MATRHNADGSVGLWRDWAASHIKDPLLRLRFLRAVAPPLKSPARWRSHGKLLLFTLCLLGVPASLLLARVAGGLRGASSILPPLAWSTPPRPAPIAVRREHPSHLPQPVWPVEQTAAFETYSNGLRIDNRFSVANHQRSYMAFSMDGTEGAAGPRRADPAGIVFHATESPQVPFEPGQNSQLKRVGESVLEFVARQRAYHFLIDRFGRVYRVVRETDAANHAGNSVWSDDQWVYVNLNESFLGVSFEAYTSQAYTSQAHTSQAHTTETHAGPGQSGAAVNPAQVRAAAMLTEMLRSRYGIAARNCVTHAQVSVNPASMLAGYHTDWASGFPFEQLGLPDNYAVPLPAIALFGFHYDPHFAGLAATSLYPGVEAGEQAFRRKAAGFHVSPDAFRKALQVRYREQRATVRHLIHDTDLDAAAAE
jgi:hypothetical protein